MAIFEVMRVYKGGLREESHSILEERYEVIRAFYVRALAAARTAQVLLLR